MKYPWEVDVAVLLIFFIRDEPFRKTFDAVKKARPKTLLLWQDGPREGRKADIEGIIKCREIAQDIDWECEIHTMYHEKNMGCDPSTFFAHKWAFSIVDKCIVLEDDFLASQSFFRYCKELLDKYEYDNRINHICGFNLLGELETCPYDYLFSFTGSGAWASWRRVADGWDETYKYLNEKYYMENLKKIHGKRFKRWYANAKRHSQSGIAYWESILGFDCVLNSRYAIIPRKNLVSNIGLMGESTHSEADIRFISKKYASIFFADTNELEFPLKHPPYVVADLEYEKRLCRLIATGYPLVRLFRKAVYITNCILHGEFGILIRGIRRQAKRMICRQTR